MKHRFLFLAALILFSFRLNAQVAIVVPYGPDTVICDGEPLTLQAVTNGYHSTSVSLSVDDQYSILLPIGFSFDFYGTTYTNFVVSSNGYITFNSSVASGYSAWSISTGIPGNANCENAIIGEYSDIYIPSGGTVTYGVSGISPNRKLVVNFCTTHLYSCTTLESSFQIILYETSNVAEVHMQHRDRCASWNSGSGIEGVENSDATAATVAPGRNYSDSWTVTTPDARRFTPDSAFASYRCDTIPYAPVPDSTAIISWYVSGTLIGTGNTITVSPTSPTVYQAEAVSCSDTSDAFVTVTIGTGPSISGITTTDPSVCGACNGTLTIHGITPGSIDSIYYSYNGSAATAVGAIAAADSTVILTGLCAGVYDNISVKVGYCASPPAGPAYITNPPLAISDIIDINEPTVCGACDGMLKLHGIRPGTSDTVNYNFNGIPQSPVVLVSRLDSSITLTSLCAGVYSNIAVTVGGCTAPPIGPATITDPPFIISDTSSTNTSCSACDGSITLYGVPAEHFITVSYNFDGLPQAPRRIYSSLAGTVIVTDLCPGTYDNIVAALNTCTTSIGSFHIAAPPLIPISFQALTNPTECGACNGTIRIYGIASYMIDTIFYTFNGVPATPVVVLANGDSTLTLTHLCDGNYANFFIKQGPCPSDTIHTSYTLTAPPMTLGFLTFINYGCHGDTVIFSNTSSSSGPLHYTWTFGDGSNDTNSSVSHIYAEGAVYTPTLTITDGFCVKDSTVTISLIHPIQAIFSPSANIVCQGSSVAFTNTSIGTPPTYVWSFGDGYTETAANPSHTYPNTGAYTVQLIATNFVPCSDTATAVIMVDSLAPLLLSITDTNICAGTYITLNGSYTPIGNMGTSWNFGDGDSTMNVSSVTHAYGITGTYDITATAYYRACPNESAGHTVNVFAAPLINLGPDTAICAGSTAIVLADNINAHTPGATWTWNDGETSYSINATAAGTYYSTVSINGCTASDTVVVTDDCLLDLPRAFSPDGDGNNDYFNPREYLAKGVTSFSMNIYNRWGQSIFETTSVDGRGWDGKFNGTLQQQDAYIYIIEVSYIDGRHLHKQGNVTLLR